MVQRPVRVLLAALLLALLTTAPAHAQTPPLTRCATQIGFYCGTLPVPLDRTGAVPGTVNLRFAVRGTSTARPLLIALAGGPGQPGVALASSFQSSLRPLLSRYRLAVVDQRGTGGSGLLRCPSVDNLHSLDPVTPTAVAACAQAVGPAHPFYTSADTVLDLDALREALGAPKLALMGISYGTDVALQYARAFPDRVERLVLDSIVGPDGPDSFLMDTYRHIPRLLADQCRGRKCLGVTSDPVGDLAAFATRLERAPIRGRIFDRNGRSQPTAYRAREEAPFLLVEGDLNPFLQAALPGALAAAHAGDDAPVLRLRAIARGPVTPPRELSFGLNVTTGCEDGGPPYPLSAPPADRQALAQAALAAIPPTDYTPFDAATVFESSYADDCLLWPQEVVRPPFTGPLPDVPALLLGGGLDFRTPVENAIATRPLLPHSTLVRVAGTGHDVLDSDITGCANRALDRFARDQPVGTPCKNRSNAVPPIPAPPRALSDFRSAPGVGGDRGRKLFAVLDSIEDARLTALQRLFAGLPLRAGGLRGGFLAGNANDDVVRLSHYTLLRGTSVTGHVGLGGASPTGTVRVGGRVGGTLKLAGGGRVTGTLGGRSVSYRPQGATAAAVARGVAPVRRVGGSAYRLGRLSLHAAAQQARLAGLSH